MNAHSPNLNLHLYCRPRFMIEKGHTDTAELSLYFLCLHDPIDPIDHVNSAHVLFIS